MLALSEKGDNSSVDMLVGDIYGQDYGRLGLKSTTIASSFGKVFKKGAHKSKFSAEDISKSLLYAVSNNIGQIASVTTFTGPRPELPRSDVSQLHECREVQPGAYLLWRLLHPRWV